MALAVAEARVLLTLRPSRTWGVLWAPGRCSRDFGMKCRVMLELVGPDGIVATGCGLLKAAEFGCSRPGPGFPVGASESGKVPLSGGPEWLKINAGRRFRRNWISWR
jgi:hypothetical protein